MVVKKDLLKRINLMNTNASIWEKTNLFAIGINVSENLQKTNL
jgi:hypothetical protein